MSDAAIFAHVCAQLMCKICASGRCLLQTGNLSQLQLYIAHSTSFKGAFATMSARGARLADMLELGLQLGPDDVIHRSARVQHVDVDA